MNRLAVSVVLLLALLGCPKAPLPPPKEAHPPPPPPVLVPPGCLASLEGDWVHSAEPTWHYRATDDGGAADFLVYRHFEPDAGTRRRRRDAGTPAPVEPHARIHLVRTPKGFVGDALGQAAGPEGQICEVHFPTEVLACDPDAGSLLLSSASSTAIGEACQAPASPSQPLTLEHRLVRADAGESRTGTP